MPNADDNKTEPDSTLGHGDHWRAIGLDDTEAIALAIVETARNGRVSAAFPAAWPIEDSDRIFQLEVNRGALTFAAVIAEEKSNQRNNLVTAYPVGCQRIPWTLQINGCSDAYGPHEGIICGETEDGRELQWFAPNFGAEATRWRSGGLAKVGLNAIALSVQPFVPQVYSIKEGPLVEIERRRLQEEGRHKEANDPDLSVSVSTETLRTLYCEQNDHHTLIGEILKAEPVILEPDTHGWLLEVQCLPDDDITEAKPRLPVYVFELALMKGTPLKEGDLIQAAVWLQGIYEGATTENDPT